MILKHKTMGTLIIISFCAIILQVSGTIDYDYMDFRCGQTLRTDDDQIRLQLTASSSYAPNMKCQLNIEAYENQQMMIYFRSMDIEQSGTCQYDFLEMHDGSSRDDAYIDGGKKCGQSKPGGVFTTSGQYLTLYFQSDNSAQFSGFDMIITPYHTGYCTSDEYKCDNGRCIDEDLSCSDYNPCGDWSDCEVFGLSAGAIVGIIGAGIVFTFIVVIAIVACRRRTVFVGQRGPMATVTSTYGYNQFGSGQYAAGPPPYSSATSYQK